MSPINFREIPPEKQRKLLVVGSLALASALLFRRQISVSAELVREAVVTKPLPPKRDPSTPTPAGRLFWPVDLSRVRIGPKFMGHAALKTYRHGYGYHTGLDFLTSAVGLKVVAMADGVVVSSTPTASRYGYGHNILIHHPALGVWTRSSHLYSRDVKAGDVVTAGQQIGRVGDSGTDNVHLHWDVIKLALPNPRFNPHNPATGGVVKPLSGLDPVEEALVRKHFQDPLAFLNARSALNPVTQKVAHA